MVVSSDWAAASMASTGRFTSCTSDENDSSISSACCWGIRRYSNFRAERGPPRCKEDEYAMLPLRIHMWRADLLSLVVRPVLSDD